MDLPRYEDFFFAPLSDIDLELFECDEKLLRFFIEQAHDSEQELVTKTYFLCRDGIPEPLVGFALSNSAIEASSDLDMVVLRTAQYSVYPAVLIGRFATHLKHKRNGYGRLAVDMIKTWFITNNKTGCRFLVVDSRPESVDFYKRCRFDPYPVPKPVSKTELLYFDLKAYKIALDSEYS